MTTANSGKWVEISTLGNSKAYYVPSDYGFNSGSYYLLYKSSSSSGALSTPAAAGSSYNDNISTNSDYKFNQTAYIYTDGTLSNAGGNVSINAYYWASGTSVTASPATSTGSSITWENAARTTTVTFTAAEKDGYDFAGWYNGSSTSATRLSDKNTYSISNITSTNTVYARFTKKAEQKFNVTISADPTVGGTVTPSGTQSIGSTAVSVTATPDTNNGYEFDKWTTTGSVSVANANSASTTVTATSAG
ncbi:MAG: hypothetical protein J1E41_06325, partial [Ruminococcus sp.]|nr:hypothetical protein [Ruminococcus sp.]